MFRSSIEVVADLQCLLGECPVWHPDLAVLFFSDILSRRVYRYNPLSGQTALVFQGEAVGGITLEADGALLFLMERGRTARWSPSSGLHDISPGLEVDHGTRFNDAIADPEGYVLSGTMQSETAKGRLYRIGANNERRTLLGELGCPNGMGFSPDLSFFYFTDSSDRTIYRFARSRDGCLESRLIFAKSPPSEGMPDGMAVDEEGCIWSARWGGSCVVRHSEDGAIQFRIALPATNITSVAFGGPYYTDLYVTSAGGNERSKDNPLAGSLFRIRGAVQGVRPFRSKLHS